MSLLNIFVNNLLPILLLTGAGFVLGKTLKLEPRTLGRVIFYILSPILVFNLITQSNLTFATIGLMMGFAGCVMVTTATMAWLLGRLLHLDRMHLITVIITSLVGNNGNFGMPVVAFAFGQEALAYASIYFVTSSLMVYTLGVLIASLGHLNLKNALLGLLKVPAIYAILLAMVFVRTGWVLPEPLQRTVTLAAGGAIPGMLILLGLELSRATWNSNLRVVSIPAICRLVCGPLIALGYVALLGLNGPARLAGITEAGMPSAVMTTIIAAEYKLDQSLVSAIIFANTLISPLTLTLVIYFLGR